MIPPNDIEKRREEIRELFSACDIARALKRLMDFTRDFSEDQRNVNEVVVISFSFRNLEDNERRGQVTYQEASVERRQLLYKALGLLDSVVDSLTPRAA